MLLPLLKFDGSLNRLAVAHDSHINHISDLAAAESIGKVVKIPDGLIAELHQNVASLQTRFLSGRGRLYVGEFHAVLHLSEIGDRSEVRAIASSASASEGFVFNYSNKRRAIRSLRELQPGVADHLHQPSPRS